MLVKATFEGLKGGTTASGYVVDDVVSFVALPCRAALGLHVRIVNPRTGRSTIAQVLDVGPWNEDDFQYVFNGGRPQAETGEDSRKRKTNGAGIDLGGRVWKDLEMNDNTWVEWEFVG